MKSLRVLRSDAARIWRAALRAVDPEGAVRACARRQGSILHIGPRRFHLGKIRKVWILGAGKAAAPMGRAMERILGPYLAGGILVTQYGHSLPLRRMEILEAGHPLPDAHSLAAASRIRDLARHSVEPEDLVLCLLSGGASALMASPADSIPLEDKLECTRLLLRSGAPIGELNAVRKHLSALKGGGLARWLAPAAVVSLILSDVVGDDVGTIASGPVSPDATTFGDCLDILKKRGLYRQVPPAVRIRLKAGAAGKIPETPKPRDPVFRRCESFIVGSNARACSAAADMARRLGYHAAVLTSRLEGDTGEAARFHMSIAEEICRDRRPLRPPACILSGGETTVQVRGSGKGGRNQEFVLHCVRSLHRFPSPCVVASLGTDGIDGPTDAAGAIADTTSLTRSLKIHADFLHDALQCNNSYAFFQGLDDLIFTGPTRTNVMDLHMVMVG